jgi:hypothetical protein
MPSQAISASGVVALVEGTIHITYAYIYNGMYIWCIYIYMWYLSIYIYGIYIYGINIYICIYKIN